MSQSTAVLSLLAFAATSRRPAGEPRSAAKSSWTVESSAATREAQAFLRAHPDSVPARILLARAYMGVNDGTAALSQLHSALLRDPDSIDALYYLSKLAGVMSIQEFESRGPQCSRLRAHASDSGRDPGGAARPANGAEREYLAALEKASRHRRIS